MSAFRSRSLALKGRQGRALHAQAQAQAQAQALQSSAAAGAGAAAQAAIVMQWCADFHDKSAPTEPAPRATLLPILQERPLTATLILIHLVFLLTLLFSGTLTHWLAQNQVAVMLWIGVVATLWVMSAGSGPARHVVFYLIDLQAGHIKLHCLGPRRGARAMTLPFSSITSLRPFQLYSYNNTCGIDISYLDDRLDLQTMRVPDLVPEKLVDAHMNALRPALGAKIEATLYHDL